LSYLATIVAAIAQFILGFLWYGPLFGKPWRSLMGVSQQSTSGGGMGMTTLVWTFIGSLVTAGVLRKLATMVGARTVGAGVGLGAWVWLGFIATVMLGSVLYEKRPVKLFILNNGYQLVSLVVMGAIVAAWR
jgi:hypothetical protein